MTLSCVKYKIWELDHYYQALSQKQKSQYYEWVEITFCHALCYLHYMLQAEGAAPWQKGRKGRLLTAIWLLKFLFKNNSCHFHPHYWPKLAMASPDFNRMDGAWCHMAELMSMGPGNIILLQGAVAKIFNNIIIYHKNKIFTSVGEHIQV